MKFEKLWNHLQISEVSEVIESVWRNFDEFVAIQVSELMQNQINKNNWFTFLRFPISTLLMRITFK